MDLTENPKHDVQNGSEYTEMGQSLVESDRYEGVNVERDVDDQILGEAVLLKSDVQESVCHLNLKDILKVLTVRCLS